MIKLQDLLKEEKIREEAGVFKNKDADAYLKELLDSLGEPTYKSEKEYGWYNVKLKDPYYSRFLLL